MKKRVVALALAMLGGTVRADAFEEYGARGKPRPAGQLGETACEIEVELRGALATVELRQTFSNPGPEQLAASYEFALPKGAVLVGAAFTGDLHNVPDAALAVRADTSVAIAHDGDPLGPDPAFVQFLGEEDGVPTYRAVVQPWSGDAAQLVVRYAQIAEVRAGALRVTLPGRASEPRLAPSCKGTIRATPGPGARVSEIRVDGKPAKGTRAPFTVSTVPVELAAMLEMGAQPILWTQREALGGGWNAQLATVIAPRAPHAAGPPARAGGPAVVFVLDGSRSMELVGHREVARVMRAIVRELPADATIDAVLFGRTAKRALGSLSPAAPEALDKIEAALVGTPASNGSDVPAALALARQALGPSGGAIVVITDGVLGGTDATILGKALGDETVPLAIHAVVLDPARTHSPGADALGAAIAARGGALVEVGVGGVQPLDLSRDTVDMWLRPGVFALGLDAANRDVPASLPAGGGFTRLSISRAAAPTLTGRFGVGGKVAPFRIAAAAAPAAPVAALALTTPGTLYLGASPTPAEEASVKIQLASWRESHPVADEEHAFAVLARGGKLAASRRALVEGRGRYDRAVAFADAEPQPLFAAGSHGPAPSAIARDTLERLFRDQLAPRAYACYQRALGLDPQLAGEVRFELFLGRGEVTSVSVLGAGDAAFHACLVDGGYELEPPIPDFTVNADDTTVARYALAFDVRDNRPVVVPGDADSATPIDIDRVRGGIPGVRAPVKVDTTAPLSGMEPSTLGTADPAAPPKGPKAKPTPDPEDPKWPVLHKAPKK
ncbi:MAG TPA: VWA domain-containing protein [Kofleriaceae bacterium]|jgi:hypothetical protein